MPINLEHLPAREAEAMAYAEGYTGTARLFARIDELERERDALQAELEDIPSEKERNQDAQDLEHLKRFFTTASSAYRHITRAPSSPVTTTRA